MNEPVVFEVGGTPVTQGSKNPVVPKYGDGRPVQRHKASCPNFGDKDLAASGQIVCKCPVMVNVLDDKQDELDAWRATIGYTARATMRSRPLLDGLCVAEFVFYIPRPKAHYGTGRNERLLKESMPAAPGKRPDVLKLARAVEDALTGIVYVDDSMIVDERIGKRYVHNWEPQLVRCSIRLADAQTVGDLLALGVDDLPAPAEFEQLDLLAAA